MPAPSRWTPWETLFLRRKIKPERYSAHARRTQGIRKPASPQNLSRRHADLYKGGADDVILLAVMGRLLLHAHGVGHGTDHAVEISGASLLERPDRADIGNDSRDRLLDPESGHQLQERSLSQPLWTADSIHPV